RPRFRGAQQLDRRVQTHLETVRRAADELAAYRRLRPALLRPAVAVQTAELDSFSDVFSRDVITPRHVGDGARYAQDAVVCPRGEAQPLHGCFQQGAARVVDAAAVAHLPGAHLGIAMDG